MNNEFIVDIDSIILESEVAVINALIDYYNKAYLFIENYRGDIDNCEIFQEQLFMESKNGNVKNKKNIIKSILKTLMNLANRVGTAIINFITKHFGIKKKNVNNTSNGNDSTHQQMIEEPCNIENIVSFTEKILDIDIFKTDISIDSLEDELYAIMNDGGGMTPINEIKNKMEYVGSVVKRLETRINEINARVDGVDNFDDDGRYVSQLYQLCNILKSLLNNYVKLIKDVDVKIKESEKSPGSEIDKIRVSEYCVRYKKGESEPIDPDLEDRLFKLGLICRSTKNYEEYKLAHDELCDILGFHKDSILMPGCSSIDRLKDGYFLWKINPVRETASIMLKPGTKLYHTSSHKGLTELIPSFRATGSDDEEFGNYFSEDAMYPTPRIYFFLKNPGGRTATSNSKKYTGSDNEYVYEYTVNKPMRVKIDTEATHGSYRKAVFIETNDPIVVEDVTEKFKN